MTKLETLIAILLLSCASPPKNVDPTGTYILGSENQKNDEESYGYYGKVQVKKLSANRILMTFGVNKGAPSYNSGSFIDTLYYRDNKAIYTDPSSDSTCKITFIFSSAGITVKEETADFNFGCGFGHGVVADGFYKKISSKIPLLENYETGERIDQK